MKHTRTFKLIAVSGAFAALGASCAIDAEPDETRARAVQSAIQPSLQAAALQPVTAVASSMEAPDLDAGAAIDGDEGTRWGSAHSDPQWIYIDLGATQSFERVVLNWETAASAHYDIQTSNDGANWTTIYTENAGDGGIDDIALSGSGRYVRMYGHSRTTVWGHSLREFEVYGADNGGGGGGGGGDTGRFQLESAARGWVAYNAGNEARLENDAAEAAADLFEKEDAGGGGYRIKHVATGLYVQTGSYYDDLVVTAASAGEAATFADEACGGGEVALRLLSEPGALDGSDYVNAEAPRVHVNRGDGCAAADQRWIWHAVDGGGGGGSCGDNVCEQGETCSSCSADCGFCGYPDVPIVGFDPSRPLDQHTPSVVRVTGSNGNWTLTVDGQPYTPRGSTWGPSSKTPEEVAALPGYMQQFRAMGGNTTRTWGTSMGISDTESKDLLDAAAAHDVRIIMGFWLVPGGGPGSGGCIDYTDPAETYMNAVKSEILQMVNRYKNHPGVLMWDIGNESILGFSQCAAQGWSEQKIEAVRIAYARFVNELSIEIHAIDPNHPTTNTSAYTPAWPYLRDHAPDLDMLGINSYGDVCNIQTAWEAGNYGKPYILTEGGNDGEWEVPDDVNGVPDEPSDIEKGEAYSTAWKCLMDHQNVALGGTMFHFTTTGDFLGVWFGALTNSLRRPSYFSQARSFGIDTSNMNTAPVVHSVDIANSTSVVLGQAFTVSVDASDPEGDALTHSFHLNSAYINGSGNTVEAEVVSQNGSTFVLRVPDEWKRLGVWKLYDFVYDGQGNVSVEARSFNVVLPAGSLAAGKPADASSFDPWNEDFSPGRAVDGLGASRWSSVAGNDEEWWQVDLGSVHSFRQIQIAWEDAYSSNFDVQVSNDGNNWNTVQNVTGGTGGLQTVNVAASGRFVRLALHQRGTPWGYSFYEVGIYP
ncbi:coagulation factor 5/8 type domain protein [Haliangium ochraceum DSM 14365]|uniref:Coagulation factor 5/8 type domain protein n=1 Tax=Haliangium ochraceum (strain DSM 14365 / JCM 11303 / SMP-2) TaxID=502025 RepID=D0LT05_HALO1|nr:coagulation factor 5/8 type domain protein [Haliangium ochraceum DSM 14365]